MKLLLAASIAATLIAPAQALAGEFMTCISKTDRGTYTATKNGGRIVLQGVKKSWSANLTITEKRDDAYFTKVNKNGIYTAVSFLDGKITFLEPETEASVDDCRKGTRQAYRGPDLDVPQRPTVLDGIKAKCAGEWPGDYRMQKYCIDTQVEAYNALRNY